jgi:hypothetical protein
VNRLVKAEPDLTLPTNLAFDAWVQIGLDIARRQTVMMWEIGDWWAYGEHRYGDRAEIVNAAEWEGPAYETCRGAAFVAVRFETVRRRTVLSFSHHKEVASLPPDDADRLLDRAEAEGWSRNRLRQEKTLLLAKGPDWTETQLARKAEIERGSAVVASMRERDDGKRQDEELIAWAEAKGIAVRIDRATAWGNPFEMPGDGDRATVIRHYREHYLPYKPSLEQKLFDLKGKVLMCWCHPDQCHGDVLCETVNLLEDG